MKKMRQAAWNRSTSNVPSAWRNFIRLMLARLQAVSSRNMYSEQGFEALIRPEFGQVCQRLIVVSYCTPGSPQLQAPSAILASTSRAGQLGPSCLGSVTQWVVHFSPASDGLHELVAQADRQVGVLEQDRAIGLAVEIGVVAPLLDQQPGLLLFLGLALDEFHHVGMPVLDRLHLGRAARLAAALDDRGDLVVNPHERQRARSACRRPKASRGANASVDRSVPVPEPNLNSMASLRASSMMSSMSSRTLWMKQAEPCGYSYGFSGCSDLAGLGVPMPVALGPLDAVLVEQADVEPDGRIERPVLMQAAARSDRDRTARRPRPWRNSRRECPNRRSCG